MEVTNMDKDSIKESIKYELLYTFAKDIGQATTEELYMAFALTVRNEIMKKWANTKKIMESGEYKTLYYLSIEFLTGKFWGNNIININDIEIYKEVCKELGIPFSQLEEYENEPGIGNGGLGRLAAAFMESLTTLNLPAYGCGIRYEYGLFNQKIVNGYQIEHADNWLSDRNVWEVECKDEIVEVKFGGNIIETWEDGRLKIDYINYYSIYAIPYDIPVVGYDSDIVNTLRLWSAKSYNDINMDWFNRGNYLKASEEKVLAESISKVLYPEDNNPDGKRLRLKQQYFFVSATIQNIIKKSKGKFPLWALSDNVVIHINDTHPALAIPELMRILMDEEGMGWDEAWNITTKTCAYTNHTIMGEALEKWSIDLFKEVLPRIYMIIKEINDRQVHRLNREVTNDWKKINKMTIIAYDQIRMANLCLEGCYSINGVSKLHTDILKKEVFSDFYAIFPRKFHSITNGITYRRWLMHANPGLSDLITDAIGTRWKYDSHELEGLQKFSEDSAFRDSFSDVKRYNKQKLAQYISDKTGIHVDPESIFDVQIKRIHEYKRQFLNVLNILYMYDLLLENPSRDIHPRTFIFAGKAAPGYYRAKLIIKLINSIANRINGDIRLNNKLKVVFLENYNVTLAEKIIPAAEISEQISTAGMEASGTGNMKLMLNGALTLGTLDGANVEIKEAVGDQNIFIFGLTADQVENYHKYGGYNSKAIYDNDANVKKVVNQLVNGFLSPENSMMFRSLYNYLLYEEGGITDRYMILKDFDSYRHVHSIVDDQYKMPDIWWKKAILNVAGAGRFSSDESIKNYNSDIWHLSKMGD